MNQRQTRRYRPRPIRFIGITESHGWRFKRYEITLDENPIDSTVRAAASEVVETVTREFGSEAGGDAPVGFTILHHGTDAVALLVDFWTGVMISQRAFNSSLDDPAAFRPIPLGGGTVCVWEMEVFTHERDAFIGHVMTPATPDLEAYLGDTLGHQRDAK